MKMIAIFFMNCYNLLVDGIEGAVGGQSLFATTSMLIGKKRLRVL